MKLIILDRDGVINQDSPNFIKSVEEWIPIENSIQAIADLSKTHKVVIATNQSGLGRGLFQISDLIQMHQKMQQLVSLAGGQISDIFYCPHLPNDDCECRKPKAGLMLQILQKYPIEPSKIKVVGDSLRDLQAAQTAKMQPILVRTGKGLKTQQQIKQTSLSKTPIFDNLYSFTQQMLLL